jgi:catechol 2,3-dioxygenase-like lactoylglutathione lyase family enzyme
MAKVIRIDHIGVAVRDVDEAIAKYSKILGAELIDRADITMQGNRTQAAYLKVGDGLMVMDGGEKDFTTLPWSLMIWTSM